MICNLINIFPAPANYMFKRTAAPPKRAAAPTAPVFIGMATPSDPEPDCCCTTSRSCRRCHCCNRRSNAGSRRGHTTGEMGHSVALDAPAKAGPEFPEAEGLGAAVAFPGFNTPSMTWTTPFATNTSGTTTRALLTKTLSLLDGYSDVGPLYCRQ